MENRHSIHPDHVKGLTTQQLRDAFLIDSIWNEDTCTFVHSHHDRLLMGGSVPVHKSVTINPLQELRQTTFFERREAGIINIGGPAVIDVDGVQYPLDARDCLYIGMGAKHVVCSSVNAANPAKLYVVSAPAHHTYPTTRMTESESEAHYLGSAESSNKRVLRRYIHARGIQSCQLMLGITALEPGSVWNTMPAHIHDRRSEVYLYFNLSPDARVFHFMGAPSETRHLVVANEQVVISPSWSVHSGAGTSHYSFVWAMAGENYDFADMDQISMSDLY